MPTASDLVTDLPADFEVFGQAVDTSLADLKGGTTGQVLSKTSGTDMDFTWVTTDDANAIQNAIVDAKGDLIAASANDTPARLAVGANGETLVADSSTSTGLRYTANFAAGKNKIINGDFNIWQRGTSFTNASGATGTYYADRWLCDSYYGANTISRQTFTPGTAPVAGYEGSFFGRIALTGSGGIANNVAIFYQRIEDVRTLAGQTATLSFWAKAHASTSSTIVSISQNFGSGGSSSVTVTSQTFALTTSWVRYSFTVSIPSISGKTIGTNSFLQVLAGLESIALGSPNPTFDIWGVQLEAGSVATAFQTATGTIQGELAACQRYYYEATLYQTGFPAGTTDNNRRQWIQFPVTMRVAPSTYSITVDTGTPTADQATTAGFRALSAVGNTTTVAFFGTVKASAEL